MCVVSAMGDYYSDKFKDWIQRPTYPSIQPIVLKDPNTVSKEEFDELKKMVEEMRDILKIASEYDKRTNQPHCEMESKVEVLKKLAELMGVDLNDIFDH